MSTLTKPTPTPEQLADAQAELQTNPTLRHWLARAGLSVEQYAVSRPKTQETLAARAAMEPRKR